MPVVAGDEPLTLVDVAPADGAAALAQVDQGAPGEPGTLIGGLQIRRDDRLGTMIDRLCSDGHAGHRVQRTSSGASGPHPVASTSVEPQPRKETFMNIDDLVLVSIDDHVVEPPDMFAGRLASKYVDDAPKVVTDEDGVDRWMYRGNQTGVVGLNAVISWPKEEWGFDPAGFAEMRPGSYDVHARVRDMDVNGITASMCFPTFAGFSAGHFRHVKDETTNAVIRAYNDWHIEDWCGAYPDRFLPLSIVPSWDQAAAVAEIKRVAAKGAKAITLPELPHLDGLPSYHDMDHWGPIFEALIDNGLVMCLHIGQGFAALQLAPDGPIDNLMIMACQISMLGAQDLLWGPAFRAYPDLKVAFSEGGIGWIPFYLDRCDRHFTNQLWLHKDTDFGGKLPSEVFREHALACYVTDPTSLGLRNKIGIDLIAWECDYPHSDSMWPDAPEQMLRELNSVGATDEEIEKISWQNACRFFDWDPFAGGTRADHTVGTLRARSTDVDTSTTTKAEYAERYALAHSAG